MGRYPLASLESSGGVLGVERIEREGLDGSFWRGGERVVERGEGGKWESARAGRGLEEGE